MYTGMEYSVLFEQWNYYISYNIKNILNFIMYYKEAECLNGKKHTHDKKKSK